MSDRGSIVQVSRDQPSSNRKVVGDTVASTKPRREDQQHRQTVVPDCNLFGPLTILTKVKGQIATRASTMYNKVYKYDTNLDTHEVSTTVCLLSSECG